MQGYFVFSNEEIVERLRKAALPLIVLGAAVSVVFALKYFGLNYADRPINRGFLFSLSAYAGSLAMLAGMARYADISTRFTEWMTAHSFGLYMFHYLGISAVALFIARPGLAPAPVCYLLSLAAGFAAGYGLYALISRIPFFRWAVLGIKKTALSRRPKN
jgi:surface polysaccharide O-acyltransferase-like enzyme